MLILWSCAIMVLLEDVLEKDTKIRDGFPMHHSTMTGITTI